jgi:hypothetical protein
VRPLPRATKGNEELTKAAAFLLVLAPASRALLSRPAPRDSARALGPDARAARLAAPRRPRLEQNAPLFIKRFDGDTTLDLILLLHSALDGFEEAAGKPNARKNYLGLLALVDGLAVFGLLSNSMVKTILVLDAQAVGYALPSDSQVEALLRRLYACYVETISNPFLEVGSPLLLPEGGDSDLLVDPARAPRHPELLRSFEASIQAIVSSAQLS